MTTRGRNNQEALLAGAWKGSPEAIVWDPHLEGEERNLPGVVSR